MKIRRPLSDVEEEAAFLRADAACEAHGKAMKAAILARYAAHGAAMPRGSLALALAYASPSAINLGFKVQVAARAWADAILTDPRFVQKAGKKLTPTEADIIEGALDAGIELGLETLPAKIRGKVDIQAARALARKRLIAGAFRQNVAAYNESVRGLQALARSAGSPAMATIMDADLLASMFGLNARQAAAIVREAEALFNYGPKNTKARLAAIRRAIGKRVQQALEARAETMGQTLSREAISTAQQALFETAKRQGLLDEDKQRREWVTRHDERVCPICDSVDGLQADVDQAFEAEDGSTFFHPPAHPRCRCSIRLVTLKTPKRQTRRRAA